jgi:AcrR family transcriptional regulator
MFPLRDPTHADAADHLGQRERNRLKTRSDLNVAATRLFARFGYDKTSVDDICREAGVSVRTFFLFAREMDMADFLDRLARPGDGETALEAMQRAYQALPPLTVAEIELAVLFHQGMATSATLQGQYLEGIQHFRGEVAQALARRAGRAAPIEIDGLAATIGQTTLDHAYERWIANGATEDLRDVAAAAFELLREVTREQYATRGSE